MTALSSSAAPRSWPPASCCPWPRRPCRVSGWAPATGPLWASPSRPTRSSWSSARKADRSRWSNGRVSSATSTRSGCARRSSRSCSPAAHAAAASSRCPRPASVAPGRCASGADLRPVADLADVTPLAGGAPVLVSVEVTSLDPRVKVLDFQPQRVAVRLDPVVSRSLPVMVDRGPVPDGLVLGEPRLGASIASVRGASSLVARVHEVAARVTIDPSGINVDGEYDLVALDERGDIVAPVDIEPERVHVRIADARGPATRPPPVAPRPAG